MEKEMDNSSSVAERRKQVDSESFEGETEPSQATASDAETLSTSREDVSNFRTSQVSIDMEDGEPEMYCTSPSLRTRMARKTDMCVSHRRYLHSFLHTQQSHTKALPYRRNGFSGLGKRS